MSSLSGGGGGGDPFAGYAWADVTASRALDVTYTNTSSRTRVAQVNTNGLVSAIFNVIVNGINQAQHTSVSPGSTAANATVFIPPNQTYRITNVVGATLFKWFEYNY